MLLSYGLRYRPRVLSPGQAMAVAKWFVARV